MSMKTKATVTLAVQVTDLGPWDDDCTAGQIRDQAAQEAIGRVSRALQQQHTKCTVISGSAKVTMVQTELDE
jgi:hypothetical protein